MKIEFVSMKPTRHLGELNSGAFFCKCGMTQAGVPHHCSKAESPGKAPSLLARLFPDRWFSTQVIIAAIVVILVVVFAFNSWV